MRRRRIAAVALIFSPTATARNYPKDALCKEGRTEEAEGILKIMVQRDGFFRNRKIGKAIKVFRSMQDQGMVPNNFIYSILINGMCKAGKIEDARKLFNSILANGLKPNVQLYNTMICGLCEVALLDEAEELLLQMDKDRCPPNDLTFNVVVRAFLKKGDRRKVKIYLQETINMNFEPDVSTMSMVVELLTVDGEDSNFLQMIQSLVPREDSKAMSQTLRE